MRRKDREVTDLSEIIEIMKNRPRTNHRRHERYPVLCFFDRTDMLTCFLVIIDSSQNDIAGKWL